MSSPNSLSKYNLVPYEVMALTIYGEARGEPVEGQIAVANVIMNRFESNKTKYRDISAVCFEHNQFSCWNEDDPNYKVLIDLAPRVLTGDIPDHALRQCLFIAQGVINAQLVDNTDNAENYLTTALFESENAPSWSKRYKSKVVIGRQTFLRLA